jgi:putative phage-type endonuclease
LFTGRQFYGKCHPVARSCLSSDPKPRSYTTETKPCHPQVLDLYISRERHPWTNGHPPEIRKKHVTATDMGVLTGLNKYGSKQKLLRKKLLDWREPDTDAMAHGRRYEPNALDAYQLLTKRRLVTEPLGYVYNPQTRIGCTVDGICADYPIVVETKCPFWLTRAAVEHGIPRHYYAQVQTQMYVTDTKYCHFVQFKPATKFEMGLVDIIEVDRDETFIRDKIIPAGCLFRLEMIRLMETFSREELRARLEPPPRKKRKQREQVTALATKCAEQVLV